MTNSFKSGIDFVSLNLSSVFGSLSSDAWTNLCEQQIEEMKIAMETAARSKNLDADHLQGFIAEFWHKYTHNTNAAIRGSSSRATMPESNAFGSVDLSVNGRDYSLKYYKDAISSAKSQKTTIRERYEQARVAAERRGEKFMSLEEYMKKRGYPEGTDPNQSIYFGQGKLIPSDQLAEAKAYLEKRIQKELAAGRTEVAENLKNVLDSLTDVIEDGKGNSSIQLTRQQAQMLAEAAKNGELDDVLEKLGITLKDLVSPSDIMRQAFKVGASAALISFVLSVAPVIVNAISMLVANGEVDADELKKMGLAAVTGSARGFLNGTVSAALTSCCKIGLLGEAMKTADPMFVGSLVALTINMAENSFKLASGKISKGEYAQEIMRSYFVTGFSLAGAGIVQVLFAEVPVIASMLGSFIGSVVGGFVYNATEKLIISYCIESGWTFFGIVEQNYELPTEVLEDIGVAVFESESFEQNIFESKIFESQKFDAVYFEYEKIGLTILKRGLIGVFNIGYV